ncbi:MAG: efflux RND transporter periplasmic adaptor subunit [Candidatus Eremiobacteraeota bacterium]|nr:efflux RND transporter periplasmic adaptor subunit [Candidatus Eremiobacteraeota bacterium]
MNLRFAAAFVILGVLNGCAHSSATTDSATQPSVVLATARYDSLTRTIVATGRVGAASGTQTRVSFAGPGVLQSVFVRVGTRVGAGEALAQLDTSGLSLSTQQAEADARAAAASARQASVDRTSTKIAVDEAAVRRAQTLYAAGVAARKDIEAAMAQLAADRAESQAGMAGRSVAGAQAQSAAVRVAVTQRDLSNGTLRSPIDGVVVGILKHPGESVDPSTPVLAIGPQSEHTVTLDVSAADATRVHNGARVHIEVIGTALRSEGRVIGLTNSLDPSTQSATVVVSGIPSGAPAGAVVNATIDVGTVRGIIIPQTAVVQDPQTGKTLVFVQARQKDGTLRFEQRTVVVAVDDGSKAVISSGLRRDERVAAEGAFALLAPSSGS